MTPKNRRGADHGAVKRVYYHSHARKTRAGTGSMKTVLSEPFEMVDPMSTRAEKQSEPRAPEPPDVANDLAVRAAPPELRAEEFELCRLDGLDLGERDASRVQVSGSRLAHVDLSSSVLKDATFRDVIVEDGSWANVRADGLSLRRVRLERVRLTGAHLASAEIHNVTFVDCRIDLAAFRFAKLERVRFESCRMEEVDFYDARLESVVFTESGLVGATWSGATLTRSEIRGCDLAGARSPERLRGVRMPWADVIGAAGELAAAVGIIVIE